LPARVFPVPDAIFAGYEGARLYAHRSIEVNRARVMNDQERKSMQNEILGILDIGKTHARLFTAEAGQGVLSTSRHEIRAVKDSPVIRELDIQGIESWLIETLRNHPHRNRIRTLVPIAHGAAAVLLDAEGNVLLAPDYEDFRFDEVADAYRALRDPFELTYSPFLPLGLNLGRQLYYLKVHASELLGRTHQLLLYPQYWAWRLSGIAASEVTSLACHSDLWRPLARCPSDLAAKQGWTAWLPPLRAASDVLGALSPEIARHTGLDPECRVMTGLHDSNASFLAHLAAHRNTPFALVSSGTWTIIMARGTDLARIREPLDMLINIDATGAPVATARFMGGREYEVIAGKSGLRVGPSLEDLSMLLDGQIMALPSFSRAGGPFPGVRGELPRIGALTPRQRATLASVYVALMTDYLLDLIGVEWDLIIDGPLAENCVYAEVLSCLRARGAILLSHGCAPAVSAAAVLCKIATVQQEYTGHKRSDDYKRLQRYRSVWREAATYHASGFSARPATQ
jgi:L-fuculokinase